MLNIEILNQLSSVTMQPLQLQMDATISAQTIRELKASHCLIEAKNLSVAYNKIFIDNLPGYTSFICTSSVRGLALLSQMLEEQQKGQRGYLFFPSSFGADEDLYVQPYRFQQIIKKDRINLSLENPDDGKMFERSMLFKAGYQKLLLYRRAKNANNPNHIELLIYDKNRFWAVEAHSGKITVKQTEIDKQDDRLWTAALAPEIVFSYQPATALEDNAAGRHTETYQQLLREFQSLLDIERSENIQKLGQFHYTDVHITHDNDYATFSFTLASPISEDLFDEDSARIFLATASKPSIRVGSIKNISGTRLTTLLPEQEFNKNYLIASTGILVLDTIGEQKISDRRWRALLELQQPTKARFAQIIFDSQAYKGEPIKTDHKIYDKNNKRDKEHPLDARQEDAVWKALNTPDIAIIQGPPGTGKTTIIQHICRRFVELYKTDKAYEAARSVYPVPRILISSFQHVAVDNVLDKLAENGMPPWKQESGFLRQQQYYNSLQAWADKVAEKIEQKLAKDSPLFAPWYRFLEGLAVYKHNPSYENAERLARLLQGISEKNTDDKLRTLIKQFTDMVIPPTGKQDPKWAEILPRQRLDRALYDEDDGWCNAMELYRFFDELEDDIGTLHDYSQERAILRQLCQSKDHTAPEEAVFAQYKELVQKLQKEHLFAKPAVHDIVALLDQIQACAYNQLKDSRLQQMIIQKQFADELRLQYKYVVQQYSPWNAGTCNACDNLRWQYIPFQAKTKARPFDLIIIDEAARAHPLDLLIPLSLADDGNKVILVGDQKQLPHMLETDTNKELQHKLQPRLKEPVKQLLQKSLFQILFDNLPEKRIMLNVQHRMDKEIADFVSREYYEDGSGNRLETAAGLTHPPIKGLYEGKALCWANIGKEKGAEERLNSSYVRTAEVEFVKKYVNEIFKTDPTCTLQNNKPQATIGVISFYAAQTEALQKALLGTMPDENRQKHIKIGTVDSFQGEQFDYVILSCVRSNNLKDDPDDPFFKRSIGFLNSPTRQCVAFSRAIRQLVVCGDYDTLKKLPCFEHLYTQCRTKGSAYNE